MESKVAGTKAAKAATPVKKTVAKPAAKPAEKKAAAKPASAAKKIKKTGAKPVVKETKKVVKEAKVSVSDTRSFMANAQNVERKWYLADATNMPLGRLASQVATVLRGKNKPTFTTHCDTGDFVIVINSDKIVLTGNKLLQKHYKTYSGYQGGLKEVQYQKMMEEKSDVALLRAIKGMLPKNSLGRDMVAKVKIYKGAEHPHAAQQPEILVLKGVRN